MKPRRFQQSKAQVKFPGNAALGGAQPCWEPSLSRGRAKQTQPIPKCYSPHPVQEKNSLQSSPRFITSSPFKWCLKAEQKSSHLAKELTSTNKLQLFPKAFPSVALAWLRRMWGLRDQLQKIQDRFSPRQPPLILTRVSEEVWESFLTCTCYSITFRHRLEQPKDTPASSHYCTARVPKVANNQENHFGFCFVTSFADSK